MSTKELISKYGDVFFSAKQIKDEKFNVIPIGPSLDIGLHGGIQEGTWTIISGLPKQGKGQPLDSIIYTPNGPTLMKDVYLGQEICSPDGTTTKIVGIYPQGKKKVYEIIFTNGNKVRCDEDHLWLIKDHRKSNNELISTSDLLKRKLYTYSNQYKKYEINIPTSISYFKGKDVVIPPYVLGCLLGDGSFRSASIKFTSADKEIIKHINTIINKDNLYLDNKNGIEYVLHDKSNKINRYKKYIRLVGLDGKLSYQKYIPEEYIYNSIENRLELIRGLMDTDGDVSINKNGSNAITYNTSSNLLAKQVKYIIESLGGIAKIYSRFTFYTHKGHKLRGRRSYRVRITYKDQKELFKLSRKKDKVVTKHKPVTNKIKRIKYIGEIETQCIKVENTNGLYVTNDFVCTHNTTIALQLAKNAQTLFNKKVFITDTESRFGALNTDSVIGLDLDNLTIIKSSTGNILSAEKHLDIGISLMQDNPGCVYIIDSTSDLCPESELASESQAQFRSSTPRLLASFCRKAGNIVTTNKITIVLIQHLAPSMTGYGGYAEDSGMKVRYKYQNKIKAKSVEKWLNKEDRQIGQIVKWSIEGSALGPPGATIQSYLRYGYGIDDTMEIIELALLTGLIKKAGAWFSSTLIGEQKFQGQENLYTFLNENLDLRDKIYLEVKKML